MITSYDFPIFTKNGSLAEHKPSFAFRLFVNGREKMAIKQSGYCESFDIRNDLMNQSPTGCGIIGFSSYNIWYENKILT